LKEIIRKGKNPALANSNGLMAANTLETFMTIIFTAKDLILGTIYEFTKEIGKIIKCMEKGNFFGLMEENI